MAAPQIVRYTVNREQIPIHQQFRDKDCSGAVINSKICSVSYLIKSPSANDRLVQTKVPAVTIACDITFIHIFLLSACCHVAFSHLVPVHKCLYV